MENTKTITDSSTPPAKTDNESEFFNLISLKLKKNEETSRRDQRQDAVEIPVRYEEIEEEEESTATQLDSEYTRAPVFPSHAYGSRPSPPNTATATASHLIDSANSLSRSSNVIYNRKANSQPINNNKSSYLFDEESSVLDPECLKSVDRKLRSMMKKTKECLDEIELNASNTSNIDESLRDIPVHDMVKKLRREFEVSGDVESLNAGLDNLWQKYSIPISFNL